jgi:hypothetical protein
MPDEELESYLAAISPDVDSPRSELTGRFGSAQVFQVRLPELRIEQLRRLAEAHGVPPTSLVVDWVIERLDREDPGFGAAVPRAPIAPRVRQPDPVSPVNPVEQPNSAGELPRGPLGRTGGSPARPPLAQPQRPPAGQQARPPAGRPARSSVGPLTQPGAVGPLTQPATRPTQPLGSGPLPAASAPLPPVAASVPPTGGFLPPGAASLMTEPALDPARSPLLPPPANPLSGPPAGSPSSPPAGTGIFAASALDTGAYDTGAIDTAATNPASPREEYVNPAQANVAAPDREERDAADVDEDEGTEHSPVTPIFRAGSELPDPNKRRGPRHRAPEPVTSLLTRRKF